jgi:hypothetical protein
LTLPLDSSENLASKYAFTIATCTKVCFHKCNLCRYGSCGVVVIVAVFANLIWRDYAHTQRARAGRGAELEERKKRAAGTHIHI